VTESIALPPYSNEGAAQMPRRHFTQTVPLDQRLAEQAERLRKEAQGTPPGVARDNLIRRARQAEEAAQMQEWLAQPNAKAPE
jgi:hypothetical protein